MDFVQMRLSVIIPGYNTSAYMWHRCLASVLRALGPDDEVICIDDGSEAPLDRCQVVDSDEKRVKFVRLVKNGGQSRARNIGLEKATGQFITFVDSDDEILPEIYNKSLARLEEMGCDIVVFGVKTVWHCDGLYKINTLIDKNCGIPSPETIKKLYNSCLLEYVWNKIYRRSFLEENKIRFIPDICPGEDTAFNLSCLMEGARVSVIPDVGYIYYRMDGTTLSRTYDNLRQTLLCRTELWRQYKDSYPGMRDVLGDIGEYSESDIILSEWRNMWRRGAETTWLVRWLFLKANRKVFIIPIIFEFLHKVMYSFLRKYCYVRPIRRWHIKKLYPNVKEWS